MRTMQNALCLVVAMAVLGGLASAEEAKAPTPEALLKALAEAGKPGPEHKKLEPFVGDWAFTMKVWTPGHEPAELKGTVERKWILGGRFVQETLRGECCKSGKTFEGLGLIGYDRAQKKFTAVKACELCGTLSSGLIDYNEAGNRFECSKEECCPLSGNKVKGRDECVIESKDRIVSTAYKTIEGKETKVMELVFTRKK
jgi:hypothetical protein